MLDFIFVCLCTLRYGFAYHMSNIQHQFWTCIWVREFKRDLLGKALGSWCWIRLFKSCMWSTFLLLNGVNSYWKNKQNIYYCITLFFLICMSSTLCPKKNIPDILNCILKTNYQILIIFGTNIPVPKKHSRHFQLYLENQLSNFNNFWHKYTWHNLPSNDHSVFHLTQCMLLHYLGKADQPKYALK